MAKVNMVKNVELDIAFKTDEQVMTFGEGNTYNMLIWKDTIKGYNFCMEVNELTAYINDPGVHSVKVWYLRRKKREFYATLRELIDGVSFIYDTNKNVIGFLFHDDLKQVWRKTVGDN